MDQSTEEDCDKKLDTQSLIQGDAKRQGTGRLHEVDALRQCRLSPFPGHAGGRPYFVIDPARVEADARFDGLSVLPTNTTLPMLSVALAYRELWRVEQIFRTAKAILDTRPIFHQRDATIVGHLFCSFLALVLHKALDECLEAAGVVAEWANIVRDLDRLEEVTIDQGDKRFVLRLQAQGCAGAVCKAVGFALPPLVRQLPAARRGTPAKTPPRTAPPWCHAPCIILIQHKKS
jgi:hypothetical protein